ncbi:hypothetical protein P3T73_12975 [Kiritimatiellota bacterium B12222]|nr:hypothetical protein P3T73_12975 [Kiritimatiellota bacterium B12222]
MKLFVCWLLLTFTSLTFAQVEISTSLGASTYLKYEGIPLRVEITNNSGEVIRLGTEDTEDLLILRLRTLENRVVPRTKVPFFEIPWVIPPGETSVRTFDLMQLFMVTQAMSYRCLQDVKVVGENFQGAPLLFDVSNGVLEDSVKRRKNDRVFEMISIHRNGRDEIMMRVTNYNNTMVLATYYLERYLKFYDPFIKMNSVGEVATLHYVSPQQVVLCKFQADGIPVGRTYYQASPGVPIRLRDNGEAGFMVEGGVEMPSQPSEGNR